jgi:DNA-directed RNA polymerase II subunit RPB2
MTSTFVNPQDWILPPPIIKKKEYINVGERDIPGELHLDENGRLFQNLMFYQNPIEDLKQVYNNWVSVNIERRLMMQEIDFGNGKKVQVARVMLTKPTYTHATIGNVPLYPLECRNTGNTYGGSIYMDLSLMDHNRCIESTSKVEFGKIPVMVGSILCHLYGLDDEKLLELGECPKDPKGIFIIKGTEKIIITQEKLRYNRIFIMLTGKESKKQVPECKITNYSIRGTSVIVLGSSNTGGITINLKFLNKDNTLNVFQIFRLLGVTDIEKMEEYILMFVKKYKNKVSLNLVSSFNELLNIGEDDVDDIEQKKGKLSEDDISSDEKKKIVLTLVNNEIFPHIINDSNENKIYLLSMMIARFCEYRIGVRKSDDRDDWGNKRIETSGRSLEYLFNQVVKYIFETIQLGIQDLIKKGETVNLSYVKKMFSLKKKDVTETFYDSFNTNNWGLKAPQHGKQEGMTDIYKRESLPGTYYQLTKINVNVNRQDKRPSLRIVQYSQVGFVDIVDTPEGDMCGLLKYKAITAFISIDRDENLIIFYLSKFMRDDGTNPCILNGKMFGFCHGAEVKQKMVELKRSRRIFRDTCIIFDDTDDILYIYCDGGRLTRPLLVINQNTGRLVYDELKEQQGAEFVRSFPNLERSGAIEYIDSWEQSYINLAQSVKEIEAYKFLYLEAQKHREDDYFSKLINETDNELVTYYGKRFIFDNDIARDFESFRTRFTHCEISPNAIFGTTSSLAPLPEHTQGPRTQYFCNMSRQAGSIISSNQSFRFDTPSKTLAAPSRPIAETQMSKILGIDQLPSGETINLAFLVYTGYNQEDAIIFKRGSLERGLFKMVVFRSWKMIAATTADFTEEFSNPGINDPKYRHLDEFGIVKEGSRVTQNTVIISKKRTYNQKVDGKQLFTIQNETIGIEEDGIVETVLKTKNPEGYTIVRVKVRQVKSPVVGDKFASRTAQKSTIGLILDDAYMPFDENGVTPDIIINPHALPSRMTINKLYEMVASSYGALTGQRIDLTGFKNFTLKNAEEYLESHGMRKDLEKTMYSGFTGEKLTARVFMGPCYYYSLKHHVKDKIQMRAKGKYKPQTHQPVDGRKNNGGLRFGEMEKDSIISHGASRLQRERLFYASDNWSTVLCRTCNRPAITHHEGERTYNVCRTCNTNAKFGICRYPYAFKSMIQLLNGLGIDVTFTTEIAEESSIIDTEKSLELALEEGGDDDGDHDYE